MRIRPEDLVGEIVAPTGHEHRVELFMRGSGGMDDSMDVVIDGQTIRGVEAVQVGRRQRFMAPDDLDYLGLAPPHAEAEIVVIRLRVNPDLGVTLHDRRGG